MGNAISYSDRLINKCGERLRHLNSKHVNKTLAAGLAMGFNGALNGADGALNGPMGRLVF